MTECLTTFDTRTAFIWGMIAGAMLMALVRLARRR